MRSFERGILVLGCLVLTAGCAQPSETPTEMPVAGSDGQAVTESVSSLLSVPGWHHTPTEEPAGFEGPPWDLYLEGRSVQGDFNGDGVQDTAILLERVPTDAVLEANYGSRAEAAKEFVREFGLFVFFSSDEGEMEPILAESRVNGIGLYGLDLRPGEGDMLDAIDFIKYDSSNFLYYWNATTSTFDEVPEGD